jgi:hypothetical protein
MPCDWDKQLKYHFCLTAKLDVAVEFSSTPTVQSVAFSGTANRIASQKSSGKQRLAPCIKFFAIDFRQVVAFTWQTDRPSARLLETINTSHTSSRFFTGRSRHLLSLFLRVHHPLKG